ncbi:hypothetical protein [Caproiciproducens sp. MSJ-32]|uniref:hypothetical protein n=1 Tax=Caproiciproducens sp. MSJ-32 TaxID=2841527 RepID=UPI001C10539D|nr:hypothetical protein [Caproiciproducens sp. MSJ-32]
MINKIGKITIYVENQEEVKKFCTEKVGFVVKVDDLMKMPYGSIFTFYDQDGNEYLVREDRY